MGTVVAAFFAYLPRLFGAVVVVVVGVVFATIARSLTSFVLRRLRFDELCERSGVTELLQQGSLRRRPSQLLGTLVFYAILIFTLVTAAGALGLDFLSQALSMVLLYTPRVLVAALLLLLGIAAAGLAAGAAERVLADLGVARVAGLRAGIRGILIAVVAILVAALLGIDVALLIAIAVILLGAVALTAALAIGLGLRGLSQNIAAGRYLADGIAEGDYVSVNGTAGTVEQIGHAMTTLRGADGRVYLVPNHHFLEHVVEKRPRDETQ
jgi:small-conductance mechanosensitive channel